MTVVDEKSHVPRLDAAALRRLARALDREGVVAAMLIGSRARGTSGPLSDVDVAVWRDPELGRAAAFDLQLRLTAEAGHAIGTDEVDVVMLNDAPPLLRHRALRDARRLVDRDPVARVRLDSRALLDYLDTKPLRAQMSKALRAGIREGRFGRL